MALWIKPILILTADIWQDVGGTGTITSASYNGTALTKVTNTRSGGMASEIWYLVNPPSGTNTVSVTVTGATDAIKLAASTFTNVVQSSPVDVSNTATGSTGNPSVSATTTTATDLVVATLSRFSTTAATSNRTSLYNNATGSTLGAFSYQVQASAGSSSDTYTGSTNNDWSMVMAAFKPYTTSPTTTVKYIHTDHLTGSSVVSDSSGAQIELLDYFPYGNTRIDSGSYNEQRKAFGHEYDSDTGLSYMQARYYNGINGRFLSEDPKFLSVDFDLSDPQGFNSYAYARNNPVRYIDPNGQWFEEALSWVNAKTNFGNNINSNSAFNWAVNNPLIAGPLTGVAAGVALVGVNAGVALGPKAGAFLSTPQAITGAIVNVSSQALQDLTAKDFSGVGSYLGTAVSGAVSGGANMGLVAQTGLSIVANVGLQYLNDPKGKVNKTSVAISAISTAASKKFLGVKALQGLSVVDQSISQTLLGGLLETPAQVVRIGVVNNKGFIGPIMPTQDDKEKEKGNK